MDQKILDDQLKIMNASLSNMQNAESMETFLDSYDVFSAAHHNFVNRVRLAYPTGPYASKISVAKILFQEAQDMKDAAREMLSRSFYHWPQWTMPEEKLYNLRKKEESSE